MQLEKARTIADDITPKIGEIRRAVDVGWVRSKDVNVVWTACETCGKERWVYCSKGQPTARFCRKCGCKRSSRYGAGNHHWKGGKIVMSKGYILIKLTADDFFYPMANLKGYVYEHRLVVAKALSRCLQVWEIVHHKHAKYPAGSIEDKQDNRYPENLQLVTDERHKQITILENRIIYLERENAKLIEQNRKLKENHNGIKAGTDNS